MSPPMSRASSAITRAALGRRILPGLLAALVLALCADPAPADEKQPPETSVRTLQGDDARQVESLTKRIDQLAGAGQFAEAVEPARKVLAICQRALGPDHWQTADARRTIDDLKRIAALPEVGRKAMASVVELVGRADAERERGRYAEEEPINRELLEVRRKWLGEGHPDVATSYDRIGLNLDAQGNFAEAELRFRRALAIGLEALGEAHPDSAVYYNNLALSLAHQGKHAEAVALYRKALAIYFKTRGNDHPHTAASYHNLASSLDDQRKYAEAESFYRKALAIWRKALGEGHPSIASCYNNLAFGLDQLGKHAEAEALYRKALAIDLRALGEDHPSSATCYDNLATNLVHQGRIVEAETLHRKALAIRLKTLGPDHRATVRGYNNLGGVLEQQGRYVEAVTLHRKALAIELKVLGPDQLETAFTYNNLAANLSAQGKLAEAEPFHRTALATFLKVCGEDDPFTANAYVNMADNLDQRGKAAEAEPLYRTALAIRLKTLGEDHPDTAVFYHHLASYLDARGRLAEAVSIWMAAAAVYERSRAARSVSGLERSLTSDRSPLPALALALIRRGEPREAWARWETSLARGLLDDLSARQLRPLSPAQREREADLAVQLQWLDERITRLAAKTRLAQDEDRQLEALRNEQSALRGQWIEFQRALDRQYQAYAGKPASLGEIQKVLHADAALIGWLDVKSHHWACVVRHEGGPVWVKIAGSGPDGVWTNEDHEQSRRLRDALAGHQPDWRTPAEALAHQRLAPLRPHLNGVTHLIVLPSAALAGVPIETLVAVAPDVDARAIRISYAPSGSMFARLSTPRSQPPREPRLLAIGDPAFPKPAPSGQAPTPPDHGIAILAVVPHSTADLFGIKTGDVLVEYNGKALRSASDLAVVPAGDKPIRVPVKLWRDGEVRALELAAGPLGIQHNPQRPAAQVVLAQRAAAEILSPNVRGGTLASLPGTRREVEAIAALFPKDRVTVLLGADATESNLQQLARSGALKTARFVHLATHGKANPRVALSSAVFLAAEPDRLASSADPAAPELAPDGQITAEQIVRTWELDTDLVVLSSCESGLGRYAGGEGYLGFAQALFVKGARTLVLSQWKIEDKATALLMTRFYQDLLGRRPGLSQPLPKAEALDEAKRWLRNLTVDEAGSELAALDRGTVRPLVDEVDGPAPRAASSTAQPGGVRPYAHPYYWASFILIGDPR